MPSDPAATDVSDVKDVETGSWPLVGAAFLLFAGTVVFGLVFFLLGQDDPTGAALDAAASCGALSHSEYQTSKEICNGNETCENEIPHYWSEAAGCVYFSGESPYQLQRPLRSRHSSGANITLPADFRPARSSRHHRHGRRVHVTLRHHSRQAGFGRTGRLRRNEVHLQ